MNRKFILKEDGKKWFAEKKISIIFAG